MDRDGEANWRRLRWTVADCCLPAVAALRMMAEEEVSEGGVRAMLHQVEATWRSS